MPGARRVVRGESPADRVQGRARLGPLASLLVSARVNKQYSDAVWYFVITMTTLFGGMEEDHGKLDMQLQYFLCLLWQEGEAKATAAHTLCGLQHFLNVRRVFPGAWRLYGAWDKAEVPLRAEPLPVSACLGICGFLVSRHEFGAAALVATAFNCFLRTGEALSLLVGHVHFNRYAAQGVLLLPWTKSGTRAGAPESVPFDDAVVAKLLRIACHGRASTDFVFAGSGSRFRALFDEALQALGLSHMGFRPYSLRRGGATADFAEHGSAATTQLRGRWASLKVCRIYVTMGAESLARIRCPPASLQRCTEFGILLRQFLQ